MDGILTLQRSFYHTQVKKKLEWSLSLTSEKHSTTNQLGMPIGLSERAWSVGARHFYLNGLGATGSSRDKSVHKGCFFHTTRWPIATNSVNTLSKLGRLHPLTEWSESHSCWHSSRSSTDPTHG